ncbi:MAG: anti-sigma factor [Gammaproteobacteria bacterium]
MKCNEVTALLNAFVDDELSEYEVNNMHLHIQHCEKCHQEYMALKQLSGDLQAEIGHDSAPQYLHKRIKNSLIKEDSQDKFLPFRDLQSSLIYSLPALLLGVSIGWGLLSFQNNRQVQNGWQQSLVSAHVGSLMANHLTDIASSDSHTVKPWFHGRLDFSPPVYDLTGKGYPLVGGRLDYIAGGKVAALVYRHRQHTINLFVSASLARPEKTKQASYSGYNVISWRTNRLDYSLVSDLNIADLESFRKLFDEPL